MLITFKPSDELDNNLVSPLCNNRLSNSEKSMKLLQEFLFPLKRSQNIFDKHNKLSQTKKGKTLQSILVSW